MRLPVGVRRLSLVVAIAVVAANALVAVPADAGPAPGLCRMATARGEVPDRFAVDACVDGSSIWLRNSLEVPVRFETTGDVEQPVTIEVDQTPAAVVTRRLEDRDGLLLPGDVMRIPIGEGEASATLADTDAGGAYVLATTLATFLPTGVAGRVINVLTQLVRELSDAMASYGNCLSGKNWLQQLGCSAVLSRDLAFAVVRAGVEGVGSAAVSLLASTATYLRFLDAQPRAITRILGSERTLTQEAGEVPAWPAWTDQDSDELERLIGRVDDLAVTLSPAQCVSMRVTDWQPSDSTAEVFVTYEIDESCFGDEIYWYFRIEDGDVAAHGARSETPGVFTPEEEAAYDEASARLRDAPSIVVSFTDATDGDPARPVQVTEATPREG